MAKQKARTYLDSLKRIGRFSQISNLVLWDSHLSSNAKLVFCGLVSHSNDATISYLAGDRAFGTFVSVPTLSKELGISESSVRRALSGLVDRGLIERDVRERGRSAITCIFPLERVYPVGKPSSKIVGVSVEAIEDPQSG